MDTSIAETAPDDIFHITHKPRSMLSSVIPLIAAFVITGLLGLGTVLVIVNVSPETTFTPTEEKTSETDTCTRSPARPSARPSSRLSC